MVIIPLQNDLPFYTQQVELDGATYGLEVSWNFREEAWFLSLFDAQSNPIAVGSKAVVGFPLFSRCRDERKPQGVFTLQDTTGSQTDPAFVDLGARVQLYYFSKGEL